VSIFLGGDNLFRRYIFDDGKTLLTMGYSVTMYDHPLTSDDLTKIEYTWSYDGYNMRFPQRPNIPERPPGQGGKTSYYVSDIDAHDEQGYALFAFTSLSGDRLEVIWEDDRENHS